MSCNKCHKPSCNNTCTGCLQQVKGTCVFYQGLPLTCLDTVKGDTYDTILGKIDGIICSLPTPTGVAYTGVSGQITVVDDVIGIDPTYTNTINTQIANVESEITDLQTCTTNSIISITTTTPGLTISYVPDSLGCGNVARINYSGGGGPTLTGGIFVNNTSTVSNIRTTYTTPIPLSSLTGLQSGDVVTIKGTLSRTNSKLDVQSLNLTDGLTTVTLQDVHDNSTLGSTTKLNIFEIDLLVISVTPTTTTVKVLGNFKTSKTCSSGVGSIKMQEGVVINYVDTSITTFINSSFVLGIPNTDNPTIETLTMELKRKI